MTFGTAVLQIAGVIVMIGALFGALVWRTAAAQRPGRLVVSWIVAALALGGLGAFRAVVVQQRLGFANARSQWPVLAGLFSAFLAVALIPTAVALGVSARRRPDTRLAFVTIRSGAWALVGVLLAAIVAFAVDFGAYLPLPGRP